MKLSRWIHDNIGFFHKWGETYPWQWNWNYDARHCTIKGCDRMQKRHHQKGYWENTLV